MRYGIRPVILISTGCLALLVLVWLVTRNSDQIPSNEPIATESGQVDSIDYAVPDLTDTPVQEDNAATGNKFVKTITLVPDKATGIEQSEHEVDLQFLEAVKKMLNTALTGDEEEAIATANLMRECNQGFKEEYVQRYLADYSGAKFSSNRYISFGNGPQIPFDSFESLESYLWKKHDQCRAVKQLYQKDVRERIKLLAEEGVVTARYIYAMWPPRQSGDYSEDTLKLLEYQQDALEYTWNNVDEREPLGILAFAQSYAAITPGLFTPSNFMQNLNFLMAARKCGLNSPWLDAEIQGKVEKMMGNADPASLELFVAAIEKAAGEISKMLCD